MGWVLSMSQFPICPTEPCNSFGEAEPGSVEERRRRFPLILEKEKECEREREERSKQEQGLKPMGNHPLDLRLASLMFGRALLESAPGHVRVAPFLVGFKGKAK